MPPAQSVFRASIITTLRSRTSCRTGPAIPAAWPRSQEPFRTSAYAAEELIAELSSAILGAELGLPVTHLDSHASYIEHWLKLLRDDDRAILTAAAKAEEAARLLLRLGGRMLADGEPEPGDVALAA
jgi:antirestriction protein ArdC